MARYGVPSGMEAILSGGPDDGINANDWGRTVYLPAATPRLVGVSVVVIVGIWEFCTLLPAEIVLWQRVSKRGLPSRTSFAPWTTLVLRYLMLCFSVTTAFIEWSTTMPSDAACKTASGFLLSSWCALVIVCSFAIAWRAQAVARGILPNGVVVRMMQLLIATLVLMQTFMTIFTAVWVSVRQHQYLPVSVMGQCGPQSPASFGNPQQQGAQRRPRPQYYDDPLLWYWVFLIIFNLSCLIIVMVALRTLASRSRGFSKFINGMLNHSLFYFTAVLLLSILSIVWRKVQNAGWLVMPTTTIEAAIMIRILLAEQNAARRPVDTTYMDHHGPSRHFSTRGGGLGGQPDAATQSAYPRVDATIQFADRMPNLRRSGEMAEAHCSNDDGNGGGGGIGGATIDHDRAAAGYANGGAYAQAAAMSMRPIFQPYSMMDNLGQAFSQVDSRNPHDLDGQSLDLSHRGASIDIGASSIYPGVEMLEEHERQMRLEKQMYEGGHKEAADGVAGNTTATDEYQEKLTNTNSDSSRDHDQTARPDEEAQQRARRAAVLATRRASAEDDRRPYRSAMRRSLDSDDDSDEDDEVGIQTVHF